MNSTVVMASVLAGIGVTVVTVGFLTRARQRDEALAEILELPYGDTDLDVAEVVAEHGTVVAGTIDIAARAVERWDGTGSLRRRIEQADLSLRPAELMIISLCGGLVVGAVLAALTGLMFVIIGVLLLTPLAMKLILDFLANRRIKKFAGQLPDALTLVSSSLSAGHTFLRSISMMAEEFQAPLSDEFRRVVAETQLGLPLVSSLERMATRLQIKDLDWLVQAIRIQQTVGGQLSELLATLADFMRARDEIRREVAVLTAEGRISAWVLGAMPVVLFIAVQVINPGYMDPMLQGWGWFWLGLTLVAMALGMWFILRMVKSVEV